MYLIVCNKIFSLPEMLGISGFLISCANAFALFFDTKRFVRRFIYKRCFEMRKDYVFNSSIGKEELYLKFTNHGQFEAILRNYTIYKRKKNILLAIIGNRESRVDFDGVTRTLKNVCKSNFVDKILNRTSVILNDSIDPYSLVYPDPRVINSTETITIAPSIDVEYFKTSRENVYIRFEFVGKYGCIDFEI